MKLNVALFVSGTGSNARVLLEAIRDGWIAGEPVLLISDRECVAEQLGVEFNVPVKRLVPKEFSSNDIWQYAVTQAVLMRNAQFIALCGYLRLLPGELCREFPNRILNIHPGPLPQFGGKGMWGHHVHDAVLASGCKWSGPTVHYVNEIYDAGDIVAHVPVPVLEGDTAETLGKRVLNVEHRLYPVVVAQTIGKYLQLKTGE